MMKMLIEIFVFKNLTLIFLFVIRIIRKKNCRWNHRSYYGCEKIKYYRIYITRLTVYIREFQTCTPRLCKESL